MNEDRVTIEWQGTGPGANASPSLEFQCRLRGITNFQQCMFLRWHCIMGAHAVFLYTTPTGTSPHSTSISGLSSGKYTIDIRHHDPGRQVCTQRNNAYFTFEIAN